VNALERQVMEFALRGEHPGLEVLREQLAAAAVSTGEYTGVGFFAHFAVPDSARRLPSAGRMVIGDVYADVTGLQHSAGFLVFVERGILEMLECFIFEDAWPAEARICRLYYLRPKEPGSSSLIEAAQRDLAFARGEPPILPLQQTGHENDGSSCFSVAPA
jgi:hypothetical protein